MYYKKSFLCSFLLALCFSFISINTISAGEPRLMIIVEEKLSEVPGSLTVENVMINELLEAGHMLVDPAQAKKLRDQVRAEVLSSSKVNKEALKKIGEDLDCDILIVGTAVADHYASSGTVKAYTATLDIRILSTSTAQILATLSTKAKARGYEPGPAIRKALEKVAMSATKDILAKNYFEIQPRIKLYLIGLSDGQSHRMALTLAGNLGTEVELLYSSRDLSEFEIKPGDQISPEKVAKAIKGSKSPPLELVQRSGHKIVARRKIRIKKAPSTPKIKQSMLKKAPGFEAAGLQVESIQLQDIYPARLINYSTAFAEARLKNTSKHKSIKNIRIRIFSSEFMSLPSEKVVSILEPGQAITVLLDAIFDHNLLYNNIHSQKTSITVTVSSDAGVPKSENKEIIVRGRNAMNWQDPASIMNFVTPTDPVIKDFTSSVLSRVDLTGVQGSMVNVLKANAIFSAVSAIPIRYISDPNRDSFTSELDYVQFPRETIKRNGGDCDDMSVLFAACLESVGIPTRFIISKDHVFLEFNTGMVDKAWADIYVNKNRFCITEGTLWIPLEMTKFCLESRCFFDAWTEATDRYERFKGSNQFEKIAFNQHANFYPAFPLPHSNEKATTVAADFHRHFADSMSLLYQEREQALNNEKARLKKLIKDSGDMEAKNQLGILLCKSGELKKAKKHFRDILKTDKTNNKARQNLGNIYLLKDDVSEAISQYKLVSNYDKDSEVLYNLGVAYFLTDKKKQAENSLRTAYTNLSTAGENNKMAWMLGVGDLKYEKMSLSHPQLEEFKAIIYKILPDKKKLNTNNNLRSKQSVSAQQDAVEISDILWWKY